MSYCPSVRSRWLNIPCLWTNTESRFIDQAPVVQKLDNAIHRINHYPAPIAWFVLLTVIRWIAIYPVDSVIQPLNNRDQNGKQVSRFCLDHSRVRNGRVIRKLKQTSRTKQRKEKRLKHKVSGYKSQSRWQSVAMCHLLLRTLQLHALC